MNFRETLVKIHLTWILPPLFCLFPELFISAVKILTLPLGLVGMDGVLIALPILFITFLFIIRFLHKTYQGMQNPKDLNITDKQQKILYYSLVIPFTLYALTAVLVMLYFAISGRSFGGLGSGWR